MMLDHRQRDICSHCPSSVDNQSPEPKRNDDADVSVGDKCASLRFVGWWFIRSEPALDAAPTVIESDGVLSTSNDWAVITGLM